MQKHYTKIHRAAIRDNKPPPPFLAVFVGCNKGFDAVDAMRMGSGDPTFDKGRWRDAMTQGGKVTLGGDVCNQATSDQFALPGENATNATMMSSGGAAGVGDGGNSSSPFSVHCIEPMPATFRGESFAP